LQTCSGGSSTPEIGRRISATAVGLGDEEAPWNEPGHALMLIAYKKTAKTFSILIGRAGGI